MEIAAGRENPYENLLQIWEDATYTKTYITGGIGIRNGEAFPESYQLPNDFQHLLRDLRTDLQRHVEPAHESSLWRQRVHRCH